MTQSSIPSLVSRVCGSAWLRFAVVILALSCFLVYLLSQHRMVFPYHDDYGVATLDFSSVGVPAATGFSGREFSIQHIADFSIDMYMRWGGRLVVTWLHAYAFKGGVEVARTIQVAAIMAVVALSVPVATGRSPLSYTVVIPMILFLAIPLVVAARGMYWFAASIQSIWGVPILLLAAILWSRRDRMEFVPWSTAILLGIAALFNEMMAAAALTMAGIFGAAGWLNQPTKSTIGMHVVKLAPALVGSAAVVLAPGNFVRAAHERANYASTSVLEVLVANLATISDLIVRDASASAYLALWIAFLLGTSVLVLWEKPTRGAALLVGTSACLVAIGFAIPSPGALLGLSLSSGILLVASRRVAHAIVALAVFLAAVASLAPLLASPTVNARSMLTFYLLMFVPITWSLYSVAVLSARHCAAAACVLALLAVPATANARAIYRGYATLYPFLEANDVALARASEAVRHGNPPETVTYYRLPGIQFANLMPYQRSYIEQWVRRYYALPDSVRFDYRPPNELPRADAPSVFPF
jgi:hypothetical protein